MSFTGDLEHLPIVDVIQLLHSTRKSGILRVGSRKGESQLVFKDGFIVSANHLNGAVRIGNILVDLGMIAQEVLDQALLAQKMAGPARKPLIVTLIEREMVKEQDAYRALENLIEMTVVEILTWKRGTFTLDIIPKGVDDDYRYYPEKISREINVDTQGVLMDALRVYDEKVRDGALTEEDSPEMEETVASAGRENELTLSADDLGLADLDRLERKIPEVFSGVKEEAPSTIHLRKIQQTAAGLSHPEQEELASFLGTWSAAPRRDGEGTNTNLRAHVLILFSTDALLIHAVTTLCNHAGILVSTTGDEQDIKPLLVHSLARNNEPLLVFDDPDILPEHCTQERISALRRQTMVTWPHMFAIQLTIDRGTSFMLDAYQDGVRAVLPRPTLGDQTTPFIPAFKRFLEVFQVYLGKFVGEQKNGTIASLQSWYHRLAGLRDTAEVAHSLLDSLAEIFERALILIVRPQELVAERGIGMKGSSAKEMTPSLGFTIPLGKPSFFLKVIEDGRVYYGSADNSFSDHLFGAIGTPATPTVLLLPLKGSGKTIALVYGDFGMREPVPVDVACLEILAGLAVLALENILYRKNLKNVAGK